MPYMIKIYILGLVVLVSAILFNGLASKLNLVSWYDFLNRAIASGSKVWQTLRFVDLLWLFIVYPMLLGLSCKLAMLITK
ncbi:MAG: DUF7672 family protein [Sediminibacterium sp.]